MDQLVFRGYDVTLITYSDREDIYCIDNHIHRVKIKHGSRINKFRRLLVYFYSLKKNDIIISFGQLNNFVVLLCNIFFQRKIIVGERNLSIKTTNMEKILFQLYRKASFVVPNSHSQEKYIINHAPWLCKKTTCIINYTNTNIFKPDNLLLNTDKKEIIGIFARFNPQKNYIRFAKAIEIIANSGYKNFYFIWYGNMQNADNTPNPYYLDFSSIINKRKIQEYIELRNHTKEVSKSINQCNAICLPSLFEGFSNSISEAIACGKPIIASNVSDNYVMVENQTNGFLFNPYDVNDMAQTIIKYLNLSSVEKQLMGENSRKKAEKLFNLEQFTQQYIRLINK